MGITISGNRFSNAMVGRPQVGNDIDVFESNSTPKYAVGFGFDRADGNKYRYAQFGAGTTAGQLMSMKFADATTALASNVVIAPASAVAVAGDNIAPGNAGSRYFEITLAGITANQMQGGYCVVNGGSGAGFTYRIKGNTSTGTPASGNVRIQLYEPIQTSLSTSSDVIITGSPYSDLVTAQSQTDCLVAGVAMSNVTSGQYGWICEKGIVGCYQETAITAGNALIASQATAGMVAVFSGDSSTATSQFTVLRNTPIIGRAIVNGGAGLIGTIAIDVG